MLQLYQITQQEASQMQSMLDISRSMSKAYADLVTNLIFSLTSSYTDSKKQSALSTSIQDLLHKGAVETVQKPGTLGF